MHSTVARVACFVKGPSLDYIHAGTRPLRTSVDRAKASRRSMVAADTGGHPRRGVLVQLPRARAAPAPTRPGPLTGANRLPAGAFTTAQHFSSAATTDFTALDPDR